LNDQNKETNYNSTFLLLLEMIQEYQLLILITLSSRLVVTSHEQLLDVNRD